MVVPMRVVPMSGVVVPMRVVTTSGVVPMSGVMVVPMSGVMMVPMSGIHPRRAVVELIEASRDDHVAGSCLRCQQPACQLR